MVALYTGNGSGTKLLQGFLDGHPQIWMVPAYPLMYLYPHWEQWREELVDEWTWPAIVDRFCIQHASVIDTRRIPGFDGLATLGDTRNEYIAIDEDRFRSCLLHLVDGEPLAARTFLLAVHYAYSFCRGEDFASKRVLVYHVHVHEYMRRYVVADFPECLVLATVRDPRSNFFGRYNSSEAAVDEERYNATDAIVFRPRVHYFIMKYFHESFEVLRGLPLERVRVVRHEDLYYKPGAVLRATAVFLGIDDHPTLSTITFGGRRWWGDRIYDMEPMNTVNPRVVSDSWRKRMGRVDQFVFEGLFFNYFRKYGYAAELYRRDRPFDRLVLYLAALLPSSTERTVFFSYLSRLRIATFLRACHAEATGRAPLKDYGFNAFYRHKWTQRDLQVWRPRGYVERLAAALRSAAALPGRSATARLRLAQLVYVVVNLVRYLGAIVSCPVFVVRRWRITAAAFRRMVRRDDILPDSLG